MTEKPEAEVSSSLGLTSLRPVFSKADHQTYVDELKLALADTDSRNIALSGNYGVGKSSILENLPKGDGDCELRLSLSALTPGEETSESYRLGGTSETTNRIQREIVKQLLYRAKPEEIPDSRFGRIDSRSPWAQRLVLSCVVGFAIWMVFTLAGLSSALSETLWNNDKPHPVFHSVVLVSFVASALGVIWIWLPKRHELTQISAGSTSIKLEKGSDSYFDQYLDEILYLFERKQYNIVVFEDIDRFNDPSIFEALRALNTILNNAPQLSKRSIKFIYAIKDSIFDPKHLARELGQNLDQDTIEALRANRTKFFDRIIPVVPFISQHNAHDLIDKELQTVKHGIAPGLIRLAGRHIPDMRLLKNTVNEFRVFKNRIFAGSGKDLGLEDTQLFAMMLFKNVNLGEFESIRLGVSELDHLFREFESFRMANLRRSASEVSSTQAKISRLDEASERAAELGEIVLRYVNSSKQSFDLGVNGRSSRGPLVLMIGNEKLDIEGVKTPNFWTSLVDTKVPLSIVYTHPSGRVLNISRESLVDHVGSVESLDDWQLPERASLREQLRRLESEYEASRRLPLAEFWRFPWSPANAVTVTSVGDLVEQRVGKGLSYDLVREGYIDENFALYSSVFHGGMASAKAVNFIIHHVERGRPAYTFPLTESDAKAVVDELDEALFQDAGSYNVYILDYLLNNSVDGFAEHAIKKLARMGPEDISFLSTFMSAGSRKKELVGVMTGQSNSVIPWLSSLSGLNSNDEKEFYNSVLESLDPKIDYYVDQPFVDYLSREWLSLNAITVESEASDPGSIAEVLHSAEFKIPDLWCVRADLWNEAIERRLYVITLRNLRAVQGYFFSVKTALDDIRATSGSAFNYCMDHLSDYLIAIAQHDDLATFEQSGEPSIRNERHFAEILNLAAGADLETLSALVASSAEECIVDDLEDVALSTWTPLASNQRLSLTSQNVSRYLSEIGMDSALESALGNVEMIESDASSAEVRRTIATAIVDSAKSISANRRLKLVRSLEPPEPLELGDLTLEDGDMFPLLLRSRLVEDTVELYLGFSKMMWETREKLIRESNKFTDYIAYESLPVGELERIFRSDVLPSQKLRELMLRVDALIGPTDDKAADAIAKRAVECSWDVPLDIIKTLARRGAGAGFIVELLEPFFESIQWKDLSEVLGHLGEPHSRLVQAGSAPVITNSPSNESLVEALQRLGVAGKTSYEGLGIRVHIRRKLEGFD